MNQEKIAGIDVSRETISKLLHFQELLKKWNPKINLISKNTINELWERHIVDSVQAFVPSKPKPEKWLDIGSGGGLPGVVVAILLAEKSPSTEMHMIESDQRKCVFLRTVARELGLSVTIHANRIENVDPLGADVISARALADLDNLLEWSVFHLNPQSGECIFPKGKTWGKELEQARKRWKFDFKPITSITDPQSVILRIGGISGVGAAI